VLSIAKNEAEYEVLVGHYQKSGTRLIRDRAHAVTPAMQGRSVPDIAAILVRDKNTVRDWMKAFEKTRVSSIFPAYAGNENAAKLTGEQRKEIQETLQRPPEDKGLPAGFWSVSRIKEYLSASYGVVYESDRSYHHVLAIGNLSFKLPEGFDKRRDDALVEKRMVEIQREIDSFRRAGHIIFAADECSLCFETEFRRAWIKKGEKTVLRVNRKKDRQHYFGALNLDDGTEELILLDWQDTENIVGALRELVKRYPKKKLALVWDNAKWHRGKELRKLLGRELKDIRLVWLPPYAPDQNPQEKVWKTAKEATANQCVATFDELTMLFQKKISGKKFDYAMSGI